VGSSHLYDVASWKQVLEPASDMITFPASVSGCNRRRSEFFASIHDCHAKKKNGVFLFSSHMMIDVIKAAVAHAFDRSSAEQFPNLVINAASLRRSLILMANLHAFSVIAIPILNISHRPGKKKVSTSLLAVEVGLIKVKERK
jgi:hypothetical protein